MNVPLTIYYQNAGGMRTKTNDFFLATASSDYDVIVLTETWLQKVVKNAELSSDYNIYRCDRSDATSHLRRGGGTLIAVKKTITSVAVRLEDCDSLEQVTVKLLLPTKTVYVCGIYLRPNSDSGRYIAHSNCVHEIVSKASNDDSVLLLGDYNLPRLIWSFDNDVGSYLPTNASSEEELAFTESMLSSGLQQICHVHNTNNRLLDLAFVSNSNETELFETPFSILPTDRHHKPFVLRLTLQTSPEILRPLPVHRDLDFNRCNYDAVIAELGMYNWEERLRAANTNTAITIFYDELFDIIGRHTPFRRTDIRRTSNPPWWNSTLRRQRNVLRKARRRFLRHRTEDNRITLRRLEVDYNENVSSSFREYIFRIENEVKADPSSFWRFVKSRKSSLSIPPAMFFEGITSDNVEGSVELFATFFKSVYNATSPSVSPESLSSLPSYDIYLPRPTFTSSEVISALRNIDPSKGPGPDTLPPVFIHRCAEVLGPPLCRIFNLSLFEGVFPDAWKISAVTPIHKSGDVHDVKNYRPISILCTLAKTLELLIHDKMYSAAKPVLSQYQHGFVKNRSTITNLMAYTSTLNSSLEKRCQVDSIYIDFAKAFDKVPHELTLRKLDKLGFPDWLIMWLRSYLRDRSAIVKLGSVESSRFSTPSGVPQGSHLGPLIFVLFVNDLSHQLSSHHLMYADDLKIYRIISSLIDCAALQQDIDNVANWCVTNGMEMNALKCKVISFAKTRTQLNYSYGVNGLKLDRVTSINDLGVILNSKLCFNEHITAMTSKAFAMLGFIRRNAREFRDPYALKTLYCSVVRSILEYAVQVWAPYHHTQITRIERVQRCFIRFALRRLPWNEPLRLPPYAHRCQLIRLVSLQQRRVYLQRMFAFDILSNRIDCTELLQQANFFVPARRSRQRSLIWTARHRTVFGQNHPLEKCFSSLNNVEAFDFHVTRERFKISARQSI